MKSLMAFIMGWSLAFLMHSHSMALSVIELIGFASAYIGWCSADSRKESE